MAELKALDIRISVDLARSLELEIVAEGVETAQQAEMLQSLGCEVFQGYYYYKPMKSSEVVLLLSEECVGA